MSSRENPIVILDDDDEDDDLLVSASASTTASATTVASSTTRIVYRNHHQDDDDEEDFDYYDDEGINNIMMLEDDDDDEDEDEDDEDGGFFGNYHHHGHHGSNESMMTRMMVSNPVRMEKYKQRMEAAKAFLQRATETSNIVHAEKIINEACELLENWTMDFDEEIIQGGGDRGDRGGGDNRRRNHNHHGHEDNPFATFLAQARHRLGQIALLKGDLSTASTLFLHVILHDSHTLSPSALAMTWYDVGVIFLTYGNLLQAEEALKHAYSALMNHQDAQTQTPTPTVNRDETLFLFIQQAMMRLIDTVATQARTGNMVLIPPIVTGLPFSSQFTVVTYNFDDSTNNGNEANANGGMAGGEGGGTIPTNNKVGRPSNIQEESRRLLDPSIWAAGAA